VAPHADAPRAIGGHSARVGPEESAEGFHQTAGYLGRAEAFGREEERTMSDWVLAACPSIVFIDCLLATLLSFYSLTFVVALAPLLFIVTLARPSPFSSPWPANNPHAL
jgi:hypothetical protein